MAHTGIGLQQEPQVFAQCPFCHSTRGICTECGEHTFLGQTSRCLRGGLGQPDFNQRPVCSRKPLTCLICERPLSANMSGVIEDDKIVDFVVYSKGQWRNYWTTIGVEGLNMSTTFKSTHEFVGRDEECEAITDINAKPCGRPRNHAHHRLAINEKNHSNTCMIQLKDGNLCVRPYGHEGCCRTFLTLSEQENILGDAQCGSIILTGELCTRRKNHQGEHDAFKRPFSGHPIAQIDSISPNSQETPGTQAAQKLDEVAPLAGLDPAAPGADRRRVIKDGNYVEPF